MKKTKKSTIFARQNKIMMNPEKIAQLKEKALSEAERYYNNAKTMLSEKASKQGDYYSDAKYVKTACGTAYCGVLILLDAFIRIKGQITNYKNRKSIEYYMKILFHYQKIESNESHLFSVFFPVPLPTYSRTGQCQRFHYLFVIFELWR